MPLGACALNWRFYLLIEFSILENDRHSGDSASLSSGCSFYISRFKTGLFSLDTLDKDNAESIVIPWP